MKNLGNIILHGERLDACLKIRKKRGRALPPLNYSIQLCLEVLAREIKQEMKNDMTMSAGNPMEYVETIGTNKGVQQVSRIQSL